MTTCLSTELSLTRRYTTTMWLASSWMAGATFTDLNSSGLWNISQGLQTKYIIMVTHRIYRQSTRSHPGSTDTQGHPQGVMTVMTQVPVRALCRIKLLPVTHVLVDTWMLTVNPLDPTRPKASGCLLPRAPESVRRR